jgi:hypothetical protein
MSMTKRVGLLGKCQINLTGQSSDCKLLVHNAVTLSVLNIKNKSLHLYVFMAIIFMDETTKI